MKTIEDRLIALERSARRWRAVAVAALLVIAGGVGGAATPTATPTTRPVASDEVRTKRLVVVDGKGNPLFFAGEIEGSRVAAVMGPDTKQAITFSVGKGLSVITVEPPGGKRAVKIGADPELGGLISVCDTEGRSMASVYADSEKSRGRLIVLGKEGQIIWEAPQDKK